MSTLYVATQGSYLRCEENQLVVRHLGNEATRVPLAALDLVIVQGPVHMTTGSIEACMKRGIPVAFLSVGGRFLGRLEPEGLSSADLQRAQVMLAEDEGRSLELARALILAKLHNSRVCLENWYGQDALPAREAMRLAARGAEQAPDRDILRGHEGQAAASYFRALGARLPAGWDFTRREAHPPRGEFNALLSFTYTLLFNLVLGAVRSVGLLSHVGFFHADRPGHACLASDLMEEWRPVLVDRLVVDLVQRGQVTPAGFEHGPAGTRMQAETRRVLIRAWERKLSEEIRLPGPDRRYPYRLAVVQQARELARHLRAPDQAPYLPLRIR